MRGLDMLFSMSSGPTMLSSGVALLLLALIYTLSLRRKGRVIRQPNEQCPLLVILGSGGHTAEMMKLLPSLKADRYSPRHFVAADTDTTSENRAKARGELPGDTIIHRIARSREVGQSYRSAMVPTLGAFLQSFLLLLRLKPALILCNGPGTCLPVCLAAALLRLIGLLPGLKIVFVESVCRVTSLSLTGKILYRAKIADSLLVQWPELCKKYPRCKHVGLLS